MTYLYFVVKQHLIKYSIAVNPKYILYVPCKEISIFTRVCWAPDGETTKTFLWWKLSGILNFWIFLRHHIDIVWYYFSMTIVHIVVNLELKYCVCHSTQQTRETMIISIYYDVILYYNLFIFNFEVCILKMKLGEKLIDLYQE